VPFFHKRNTRILFLVGVGIAILLFGYYLSNVFNPFLIAFFLAYMLNPLVTFLEKKRIPRSVSIIGFIVLILGIVVALFVVAVPIAVTQVGQIPEAFMGDERAGDGELVTDWNGNGKYDAGYIEILLEKTRRLAKDYEVNVDVPEKERVAEQIIEYMGGPKVIAGSTQKVLSWMFTQVLSILNIIIFFLLVPIYLFFFLREMNAINESITNHLPGMYRERILDIWHQIHRAVAGFFRGRLVIAVICAAIILPVLLACGVRFGLIIAIVAGITMIVPYLWVPCGFLPAIILTMLDFPGDWTRLVFAGGIFIVVANLDQFVFTPKIVGKEVELHPVTIILSMFVFGSLFGFFGLLLSIPLAATLKILGKEFVLPELRALADERKAKKGYFVDDKSP
jgi:predicted PurR-regulated permease PerM